MKSYTETVSRLISNFEKMPGIGHKTAERLTFYILKIPKDEAMEFAFSIRDVKRNIHHCKMCSNLAEGDRCPICVDPRRDRSVVCVVEYPRDLIAIEEVGEYRGMYHVLMGVVSPIDDVKPGDIRIDELVARVKEEKFNEVIIFTNPTSEGDLTALHIAERLKDLSVKLTRMARGVPAGSELEFVNRGVIADALRGRIDFHMEGQDG